MAINVSQAFKRTSANPIDDSLTLSKAQMVAVNDNLQPAKWFTICADDGYIYLYDKTNEADPTTGKFRKFEGGGSGGSSALSDLTDTDIDNPSDGDILVFDAQAGKWINGSGGSASVAHLGDVGDVDLTNIANGQIIMWDATAGKWVNANAPSGDNSRELKTAEYAQLTPAEKMNGTTYYITDGEGGGNYSAQSATLQAGSTTVSFTYPASGNYLVDIYASDGRDYTDVLVASNTITVTFEAPSADVTVYCVLKEV